MNADAANNAPPTAGAGFAAVILDMDGVVTETATSHAAAWKQLFDETLPRLAGGDRAAPLDLGVDYHAYIDGRSREDGIRAFLASRGLALPEGATGDPPGSLTVAGLAARKQHLFTEQIARHGVMAYRSTVDLLRRLRGQSVLVGLVTASRNSRQILAAAGVRDLFDTIVDGTDAARLRLSGKPAPDLFVEAARRLGVPPDRAVIVEDAAAGVRAAVAGGFGRVIGIDRGGNRARLHAAGADLVVADLAGVEVV